MRSRNIQFILDEKYDGDDTAEGFKKDIILYDKGVPLGYIIGFVPFLGCKIDVSRRTLIPRPETEYWVEQVLNTLPVAWNGLVCDVFAGSGCIGVAIVTRRPQCRAVFLDNDTTAIEQVQKNIELNDIGDRATALRSDMFASVDPKQQFDYIFANPPYVSADSTRVEKSVLEYEPHTALFAEQQGFGLIQKTIEQSKQYLQEDGVLVIEHDPEQVDKLHRVAKKEGWDTITTYKDQYNKDRYTTMNR